ncbi:DUF3473 domain-containing protein, partial [bacterium]|nr:DUF3473 domain-containing protein [bacterium]
FSSLNIKATFFVLGWIAEKVPSVVKEIASKGHEIASHGYHHQLVYNLTDNEFINDIKKTKKLLEQISGQEVIGYRAPSYSITKKSFWALSALYENGYCYDSSIFPIHHHRYGIPEFCRFPTTINLGNGKIIKEYPISTVRFLNKNFPVGGGAYARLFPLQFTLRALNYINTREHQPFVFYFHPWEIDPDQPKMKCGLFTRLRHYGNIGRMENKLKKICGKFKFSPLKEL